MVNNDGSGVRVRVDLNGGVGVAVRVEVAIADLVAWAGNIQRKDIRRRLNKPARIIFFMTALPFPSFMNEFAQQTKSLGDRLVLEIANPRVLARSRDTSSPR